MSEDTRLQIRVRVDVDGVPIAVGRAAIRREVLVAEIAEGPLRMLGSVIDQALEVSREQTAQMVAGGMLDSAMMDAIGRKRPLDAEGLARWIKMYQALPEEVRDAILEDVPDYEEIARVVRKASLAVLT